MSMSMNQLRKKYRPTGPLEALEDLARLIRAQTKDNFSIPLVSITTQSGHQFRAYLLSSSDHAALEDKCFMFSIEMVNQGEGANDLLYIEGRRIESVTFLNIDDYKGILPRFNDKHLNPTQT